MLLSATNTLLSEIPNILTQSEQRNRTLLKMIEQLKSKFQLPDASQFDFECFSFKKSKKAKNLKRVLFTNNEVVDLLSNFKDETTELIELISDTETRFKQSASELLSEAQYKGKEEKIRGQVARVRTFQRQMEGEIAIMERQYSFLVESIEKNFGATSNINPVTRIPTSSQRNSLEILTAFFYMSQKAMTNLRNYSGLTIQALKEARKFETENADKIKQVIEAFVKPFNSVKSVIGSLQRTVDLLSKFDPKQTVADIFSPETLLSFEDLEIMKRQLSADAISEALLERFIKEATADAFNGFITALTVRVWKGLVVGDKGIPFQTMIKLTREGTLVIYKFDYARNQLLHFKTVFSDQLRMKEEPSSLSIKIEFQEGRSKEALEFILDDLTKREMVGYLREGVLQSLVQVEEEKKPSQQQQPTTQFVADTDAESLKSEKTSETLDETAGILNVKNDILEG